MEEVRYFDNDFSIEDWALDSLSFSLPELIDDPYEDEVLFSEKWDDFFENHNSGKVYKPRRYLRNEFFKYLNDPKVDQVLEVGCGHGCSMFPLLKSFSFNYIATDYSPRALEIIQDHPEYIKDRVNLEIWDVTQPFSPVSNISSSFNIILSIFALSAVHNKYHRQSFINMKKVMDPAGSYLLFRDYAHLDMTMFRHKQRFSDRLYLRSDGTLCYYFDLDYLKELVESAGLKVIELSYATVINRNRKTKEEMKRVFIHGVFYYQEIEKDI